MPRHAIFDPRVLFLPGTLVEDERTNQRGTAVVPSAEALKDMPDDSSVFVLWDRTQRYTWVEAKRLRVIHRWEHGP